MSEADLSKRIQPGRRRLLGLIGALGCLAIGSRWPWRPPSRSGRQALSLREADFYRPHGAAH